MKFSDYTSKEGGVKLPNGLIINWGEVTPESSGTSVSFAVPFSDTSYTVAFMALYKETACALTLEYSELTTSSATFVGKYMTKSTLGNCGGDRSYLWLAIGY